MLLAQHGVLKANSKPAGESWSVVSLPAKAGTATAWQEMIFDFPALHPELILLERCAEGLAELLRDECEPEQLLRPGGSWNMLEHVQASSAFTRVSNQVVAKAVAAAISSLPEGRRLRILEIGAATGGVSKGVLAMLPKHDVDYCFTDTTDQSFSLAGQKLSDYPFVRYQTLDLDLPVEAQGFAGEQFDVIIATNALSLSADLPRALAHTRQLLASGGWLIAVECERPTVWHDLVSGMDERWWRFNDARTDAGHPLLNRSQWQDVHAEAGFADFQAITDTATKKTSASQMVLLSRGPAVSTASEVAAAPEISGNDTWLIFADQQGLGKALAESLQAQGQECLLVHAGKSYAHSASGVTTIRATSQEDYAELIAMALSKGKLRGIVHLWSLDTPAGWELTTAELAAAQTFVCHSPLLLVQALVAASASVQVYFVTRGARPVGKEVEGLNLAQSPLHGFVRVIMNEHAELQPKAIDLDHASATSCANDAWLLTQELLHSDLEDEIAWRGEARHVIRLVRDTIDALHQLPAAKPAPRVCHRLESARPGALDQLVFRAKERRKPGPGEVEIEICAAALNFRDVMKALGIYPAEADDAMQLGDECAGHVVAVGKGVKNFKVGDAVMALAAGCFATHVTTPAFMVMSKPAHLTMEEAATMMVTYLTASYALTQQGRMEKGERVLIHAGTGGVGQAAIRIAQEAGAEIFTTAGSTEKRRFLHHIGVPHVLDSRTVTFGEEIMKITNGEGIDMVLNSLAGEAIHQSLAVLRQYGRFLEIGKRDIYGNTKVGLFPFRKNLSYHAIDLGHALNPRNSTQVMGNLRQLFSKHKLPALPYRSFPLAAASDAFRYITQARQIGKVVLNVSESPVPLTSDVPAPAPRFKSDASYLVVGGLGGYGLVLCKWLVDNGARHLVLTGRRGLVDQEAIEAVAVMRAAGATVTVLKSDASRPEHVRAMLKKIQLRCPPLRGIFHVAMVLDDGLITQLDAERFKRVTTPKMDGAWNLHQQTLRMKLDHFVLFSSVSALVGSPGQANYAAANAFLDALAQHRRSQGLPALSINWGVLSEVGVVARNKKLEERFERIGWSGLSPSETLPILGRLLNQTAVPQMMVARIDWNRWAANTPRLATIPRFAQLTTEEALKTRREAQDADWLRNSVLAASGNEQFLLVESFLRDQIARVLRTTPSKLDAKRPINEIGMDSLMAVELIHQIEVKAGVVIPTSQLMSGAPTIHKLTELMLHNLTGGKMEAASTATEVAAGSADISNDSFVKDADLAHWGIRFADATAPVKAPKHILLTGAQEFLGAYLLRELLQQTQAKIHCFSSAADSSTAMQEIVDHLTSHACWKNAYRTRIIPVLGDLGKPLLGLTPADFDRLASTMDVIYHAAAHINHIAAYDQLKAVNVNGSVEIIRLAAQDRLKPVHYLSSASVLAASNTENDEPLHEDDPLPAHAKLMVGYSQSRWVSEQLFLQAREHGLPVNVYRPGLLVGDDQTGICPTDNIAWLFLKTCIETGSGPIAGYNSILTPVDFVAAAMVRLSQDLSDGGHNYHLINPSAPTFGELLELVRANGYPLRMVTEDQWEAELTGGSMGIQMSPIAAYQLFIPRQTLSSLVQDQSAVFCRNMLQGLHGTGVNCPSIDQTRMHLYLQHFMRTGFLPPPGSVAEN
ncbi:MAG: hypothetical protein B7Z55_00575 [Planctomycetales bacterium 12-60-4]|nr:MAG: hypothetical protein B7Z55_00575 [Planctomycetales bacterium 12-60-4]